MSIVPGTLAAAESASLAIWRDHFCLTGDPFTLTPDPAFLFLSEGHAEALAGLRLGLIERRGLIVMIGDVGTGKTTLVYSLLSTVGSDFATAYVANTALTFDEILESALEDFGVSFHGRRRLDLIDSLNSFLVRCAEAGRTAALVIDESQNLSDEAFEGLRLLLNFETRKSKLLQIILVGQPELGARLRNPQLRQITDRIALRCYLEPLSRGEARSYIGHRLEAAGASSELFTRPALSLVVKKSRGNPRRLNVLCHNSMLLAYGQAARSVSRPLVAAAVRQLRGRRFLRISPSRWRRRRNIESPTVSV